MQMIELSEYAPKADFTPPIPEWKKSKEFRDALPDRDLVEIAKEKKQLKTK